MPRSGNTERPKDTDETKAASSATPARTRAPRRKAADVGAASRVAVAPIEPPVAVTLAPEYVNEPSDGVESPVEAPAESPVLAEAVEDARVAPHQYLTFLLDEQEYGIEIQSVQEIRGYTRVTALPNSPRHLKGLLNVRGTVIPVFDMRVWFGKEAIPCTPLSVIVTVNVGARVVGLLVDGVSDVREVQPGALVRPPDMGVAVNTSLLTGLAAIDDRLLTVLSLEQVVEGMLAA